jgi:hypothetical protein
LLVAESYESCLVGCETGEVGHVAIGHDGRHGGFAGVEAAAGWMRGVHVRALASVALYFLHLERSQVLKYGKGLRIAQRGKEREGWKHLLIATVIAGRYADYRTACMARHGTTLRSAKRLGEEDGEKERSAIWG